MNTNINENKKLQNALKSIYGVGSHQCLQICNSLGISSEIRMIQLKSNDIDQLNYFLTQNYESSSEIRRSTISNIRRLIKIGSYRGFRHVAGLSVRGQRTHSNSQTVRKIKISLHNIKK